MKNQLDFLARLQAKDLVLDTLLRRLAKGPERIKERQKAVEALEKELTLEKGGIDEKRKIQRQWEMEVEAGLERIKKSKTKLIDIKNNKEYQAVLSEIEKVESANAQKEDNILVCMEELERLRTAMKEKEKRLSKLKDACNVEIEEIRKELEKEQAMLEKEKQDRDRISSEIDSKILKKYEILKSVRGGVAVSQVEKATCSGCNMSIPPQMYNELQRRDTLEFCPNCDRIIYWSGTDKTE